MVAIGVAAAVAFSATGPAGAAVVVKLGLTAKVAVGGLMAAGIGIGGTAVYGECTKEFSDKEKKLLIK